MKRWGTRAASTALLGLAVGVSGCATLPSSGPTAQDIVRGQKSVKNDIGFKIVTIDSSVVGDVTREDSIAAAKPSELAFFKTAATNDGLGPGDVLSISVFEVGVSLFGAQTAGGFDPSARSEILPPVTVDRNGAITLPYAGRLMVAGRTPADVQRMIEDALRSFSQKPQVIVSLRDNVSNTVILFGAVRKPGRYPLTLGHERLLDAVALGGGLENSAEDTIVRVTRGASILEERLGRIRSGDPGDFPLMGGDRVELIKRPRTFLILGASSHVSQVSFETGDVSLAEAVARAGGPTDSSADPSAIFLFRYDPQVDGAQAVPIVYRLNMLNPTSYFLAQRFLVRDKDVIYIGNAAANQPAKLVAIINQLFSPIVTARALARSGF